MNHALIVKGYPLAIISPCFKMEYNAALDTSRINNQNFVKYIIEQVLQAQNDYTKFLRI